MPGCNAFFAGADKIFSLLDELDEELMIELDEAVRKIQLSFLPIAKSGKAETLLQAKFPNLVEARNREQRAWIDELTLSKRRVGSDGRSLPSGSGKTTDDNNRATTPTQKNSRRRLSKEAKSAGSSPALRARNSAADLIFLMDEDHETSNRTLPAQGTPSSSRPFPLSMNSVTDRRLNSTLR